MSFDFNPLNRLCDSLLNTILDFPVIAPRSQETAKGRLVDLVEWFEYEVSCFKHILRT